MEDKIKKQKDLEKNDIIKVAYGEYQNIIVVVVDKVTITDSRFAPCQLDCHYLKNNEPVTMHGDCDDNIEVLGVAYEL